ncbi:MAG: hypothetical protein WC313_00890 [Candidatus Kapaibacterium sp.]
MSKCTLNIPALLSAIILMVASSPHVTYFVMFKANQDYIAANLCIDKNKPENSCQGCCQLEAVLNESDDTDMQNNIFVVPELSINAVLKSLIINFSPGYLSSLFYLDIRSNTLFIPIKFDTPPPELI